jgi:hypothetical protein
VRMIGDRLISTVALNRGVTDKIKLLLYGLSAMVQYERNE